MHHTENIITLNNRPFPHSNKHWRRGEMRVESRFGAIVCMCLSGRSILAHVGKKEINSMGKFKMPAQLFSLFITTEAARPTQWL